MILKMHAAMLLRYIDELNKLDQEYLTDPDLKKFAQSYLGKDKLYSFDEDLLHIHEKMLEREKDIAALTRARSKCICRA